MAYRVIRMDLEVVNFMLGTGSLYAPPENAPEDLRVVDARVVPSGPVGVLELLCYSRTFRPDPSRPVRALMCGKANAEDWNAPEFALDITYRGHRVTLA